MNVNIFRRLVQRPGFLLLFLILIAPSQTAFGQGTSFTYQGRLGQNGAPYDGPAEMQFTLFDVPSGGAALAVNTPATASVDVSDGLFTIGLDFGIGVFNGDPRWLEIAVRTNGTGVFTTLAPRQPIAAVPYAMAAREVTGSVAAERLTGTIQVANIGTGVIHSNHLALGSIHSNHLVIGSIHSNHLTLASIGGEHLRLGSVHSNILAPGSIHSNHLVRGIIHSNHLALGSIHSNHLVIGSIHSNHLALGSIHSNHLVLGAIHSNHLALGSITADHLVAGSIHSNHLALGSVSLELLRTAVGGTFSSTLGNPSAGFDYYGYSVAGLGTDKVVVGAYDASVGADNAGAAYVLSASGALLNTIVKPIPANQDRFGVSVAVVGDKVLVGADGDDAGALDAGAAHLFSADGIFVGAINNPTPATADWFGYAVAAVGADKVLVGAYGDHYGANLGGAAYLFSTNRTLLMTFNNPTPWVGDRFGVAVAAVGADKVLIGADRDDAGAIDSGMAYLFHINGTLLATFNNPTPQLNDYFGASVAEAGPGVVIIGAPGDSWNGNAGGAAYLFTTSGTLAATINNPTPLAGDEFGVSVGVAGGDKLVIGAAADDAGATDAGAAYLFSATGSLISTFNNPAPAANDRFGQAVAGVGLGQVIVGASQDNGGSPGSGAAHMFSLSTYLPGLALSPTIGVLERSGANLTYTSGNIGIGISNPEYPLDVAGPVRITSFGHGAEVLNLSTERSWAFRQFSSGASAALELASIGGGGNKNFVINTTGLVGIGTTAPQATLQVSGNNSHLRLHDTGRGNYWNIYTENHPNQAGSGNLLFVPGPNSVAYSYIRRTDGGYFSSSDARLKKEIQNLDGVLDRLLQMRPVSYRFNSAPDEGPRTFGLIAQEVERLFPEVVDERDGTKSLAYSALIPVTVGAIQELSQKLTKELKQKSTEISELKQSVDELRSLVKALSRRLDAGGR